jgi:hypothetical protein
MKGGRPGLRWLEDAENDIYIYISDETAGLELKGNVL